MWMTEFTHTPKPENKANIQNKYKHYTTRIQVHTRLWFTLNRDHNLPAAHSHLFQLCRTCQTEIQQLNKVPLLTHHGRKQVFSLLLQKQTSDSGR